MSVIFSVRLVNLINCGILSFVEAMLVGNKMIPYQYWYEYHAISISGYWKSHTVHLYSLMVVDCVYILIFFEGWGWFMNFWRYNNDQIFPMQPIAHLLWNGLRVCWSRQSIWFIWEINISRGFSKAKYYVLKDVYDKLPSLNLTIRYFSQENIMVCNGRRYIWSVFIFYVRFHVIHEKMQHYSFLSTR